MCYQKSMYICILNIKLTNNSSQFIPNLLGGIRGLFSKLTAKVIHFYRISNVYEEIKFIFYDFCAIFL
jgi:hypothetical protein